MKRVAVGSLEFESMPVLVCIDRREKVERCVVDGLSKRGPIPRERETHEVLAED